MEGFVDPRKTLKELDEALYQQYLTINQNIAEGKNSHIKFKKNGRFTLSTPKQEESDAESLQMDRIEHVHRFTRAVSVGNPREFLEAEKEDQEMEEACKRLIKNCIICWNYLYLSQKLEEIKDPSSREAFLDAVAHGSAAAWRHFNLLGEYDFSEEKLRDSMGIRLPKLMN